MCNSLSYLLFYPIHNTGSNIIRLHKRATSRFGTNILLQQQQQPGNTDTNEKTNDDQYEYEKDLVTIWLQYAKVQYKFNPILHSPTLSSSSSYSSSLSIIESDVRSTFQLLQNKNLGHLLAEYYIAIADFEIYIGQYSSSNSSSSSSSSISSSSKKKTNNEQQVQVAIGVIESGIKAGAKPVELLQRYLEHLKNSPDDDANRSSDVKREYDLNVTKISSHTNDIESVVSVGRNKESMHQSLATSEMDVDKKQVRSGDILLRYKDKNVNDKFNTESEKIKKTETKAVAKYISKKRPASSALRSKLQVKRTNLTSSKGGSAIRTLGGPPKRISSIDDDNDDDDDDDSDKTQEIKNDLNESLDDLLSNKPKIAYLEKKNEKITNEYRKFLDEWDPNVLSRRGLKPIMEKIDENTIENQQTSASGMTTSTGTGSKDYLSKNSSLNSVEVAAPVENKAPIKDEIITNHKEVSKNEESIPEISNQVETTETISPASLSSIDPDFLPLIHKKRIVTINSEKYLKLGVVGKGGSCKVYRSLTKEYCTVAIKKVRLAGMSKKAIEGYANEIKLLQRLRGNDAIIQLYDSEVDIRRKAIFLVMEAGESDLNHVVSLSLKFLYF